MSDTDEAPVLDSAELTELSDIIGMDGLIELVDLFAGDTAPQLDAIAAAVEGGDAKSIRYAAHSYKGAAAGVGALRVAALAGKMEHDALAGEVERATGLLVEMRTETDRALAELRAFVSG